MQNVIPSWVLDLSQKILVLVCIALPPWLSFIKYFRNKLNIIVVMIMFSLYGYLTYKTGEIPPFILVLLILYFIHHHRSEDELYHLRPLGDKKLEVFIKSMVFKFGITIINVWVAAILVNFGLKLTPQEISKVFLSSSWPVIIFLSLLTVVVAPLLEEFIFRHTLYRQLSKRIGRIGACAFTSILFAALHFNFLGTISFLGVAIYNCYLYDKYGYRAAVLNHFVFNSVSTVMMIILKITKS